MKKKNVKNSRTKYLRKGKIKDIGFWEKISLKIAGHMDGIRGLPREDKNGQWISPHIDKEIRSYDEFSSSMFGQLQIEEEKNYVRLDELIDSIVHINTQLENAKAEFEEASRREVAVDVSRKYGEGKLTDDQVAARRLRERDKRLEPFKNRISSLNAQLISEIDEFSQLRNKIIEDNNATRMVCNRIKDHLYMRLDVYWNSALRKHSENSKMPAVPSVEISSRSEEVYMYPHYTLMQRSEGLSQIISNEEKEAA